MNPEISYFFAAASLAVHPQISVKNSLKLKGCKHIFSLLILLKPPRFNPIHVNLKIKKGESSSNISGSASNYRTDCSWYNA
jgi:hypothetical protein